MSLKWLTVLLIATLLTTGCSITSYSREGTPLPPGTLNAMELRTLFSGQTVKSKNAGGAVSLTYYAPDGTLQQHRDGQLRTGSWKIKSNGRICLEMEQEEDGKCRIIARENNQYIKYVVKKDGQHQPVVTYISFEPGNRLGP